jgi:hypothetical protein
MKRNEIIEGLRDPKDNPCWKGYKPVGTKKKGGKTVPNCVPNESISENEFTAPGHTGKIQDLHMDMMEKNPQYAKEHAALGIVMARGITGASAETNKKWFTKTAQLLQKYGVKVNESVAQEGRRSYDDNRTGFGDQDRREFKRREMEHELGHETNNYAVAIDGRTWKVFASKNHAQAVARSLQNKGKNATVHETGAEPTNEAVKKDAAKPRNFVAKNAKMGGAGQHKDKKKAEKQGEAKHKKPFYETGELKVQKDDDKATVLLNPATGVQTQIDKTNPNSPRLTQDPTGKLKLTAPQGAQSGGIQQKPNFAGKSVSIETPPLEDVNPDAMGSNSPIGGDEEHDEISRLLVKKLQRLAGL